jgi:hypothetical protein
MFPFPEGQMPEEPIGLLVGAKRIAATVFGDEAEHKRIYGLKTALGLFRLNGQLCGRRSTILSRIEKREAESSES